MTKRAGVISILPLVSLFVFLTSLLVPSAQAFQVVPMDATLATKGPQASATFELENKGDKPVPIEVSIANRVQDLNGNDVPDPSTAAEEKFVIYPPQLILDPKAHRSVRVTWIGGHVDRELAFRVNFQELALPTKAEKKSDKAVASVNILFRYAASLYVKPENVVPKIVLLSAEPDAKDKEKMALLIENQGTCHTVLKGFTATLALPNNGQLKISDKDVPQGISLNILSNSKAKILIPWPKGLAKGSYKGDFVPKK